MSTFEDVAAATQTTDGVAAFNEATMLAVARGETPRHRQVAEEAAAIAFGDAPVELAVHPDHRGVGLGRRLVDEALDHGETRFWAHGDLPPARALAATVGLRAARTLLVLRRPADPIEEREVEGVMIRSARESDVAAIVDVNGRAFASHPEQGAMGQQDFWGRASADWFDWDGLFVAERGEQIVGFHWTKVEHGVGEVYVVGVDPTQQGTGLGTALTARGLRHLVDQGVEAIDLYVEGDNEPALAVYHRLGFVEHARDVLYAAGDA